MAVVNHTTFCFHWQNINNEEELFEWEVTPFPQVQVLISSKEPFERLWNTAIEFHEKHDKWMNGNTYSTTVYAYYVFSHV